MKTVTNHLPEFLSHVLDCKTWRITLPFGSGEEVVIVIIHHFALFCSSSWCSVILMCLYVQMSVPMPPLWEAVPSLHWDLFLHVTPLLTWSKLSWTTSQLSSFFIILSANKRREICSKGISKNLELGKLEALRKKKSKSRKLIKNSPQTLFSEKKKKIPKLLSINYEINLIFSFLLPNSSTFGNWNSWDWNQEEGASPSFCPLPSLQVTKSRQKQPFKRFLWFLKHWFGF